MSNFLYHSYEAGDLELHRPVVFFRGGKEPRKKKDWLDDVGRRPTFLRDGLTRDSVKNYGFKAELLGGGQVYPEDFFWVVVHQRGGPNHGFLNV